MSEVVIKKIPSIESQSKVNKIINLFLNMDIKNTNFTLEKSAPVLPDFPPFGIYLKSTNPEKAFTLQFPLRFTWAGKLNDAKLTDATPLGVPNNFHTWLFSRNLKTALGQLVSKNKELQQAEFLEIQLAAVYPTKLGPEHSDLIIFLQVEIPNKSRFLLVTNTSQASTATAGRIAEQMQPLCHLHIFTASPPSTSIESDKLQFELETEPITHSLAKQINTALENAAKLRKELVESNGKDARKYYRRQGWPGEPASIYASFRTRHDTHYPPSIPELEKYASAKELKHYLMTLNSLEERYRNAINWIGAVEQIRMMNNPTISMFHSWGQQSI